MERGPVGIEDVESTRQAMRTLVRELGLLTPTHGDSGCTLTEMHILHELRTTPGCYISELAPRLRVDKSTISRAVTKLSSRRLIKISVDRRDARRRQITLSAAGKRKVQYLDDESNNLISDALGRLHTEQRSNISVAVHTFARAVGQARKLQECRIRRITSKDNQSVAKLIRDVRIEMGLEKYVDSVLEPEEFDMYQTYLDQESRVFWVAELDGEIIGGAGIEPLPGVRRRICELRRMYVRAEGRGIGLGRKLLLTCLESAIKLGYEKCYLETVPELERAQALYLSCGFRPVMDKIGETSHCFASHHFIRDL